LANGTGSTVWYRKKSASASAAVHSAGHSSGGRAPAHADATPAKRLKTEPFTKQTEAKIESKDMTLIYEIRRIKLGIAELLRLNRTGRDLSRIDRQGRDLSRLIFSFAPVELLTPLRFSDFQLRKMLEVFVDDVDIALQRHPDAATMASPMGAFGNAPSRVSVATVMAALMFARGAIEDGWRFWPDVEPATGVWAICGREGANALFWICPGCLFCCRYDRRSLCRHNGFCKQPKKNFPPRTSFRTWEVGFYLPTSDELIAEHVRLFKTEPEGMAPLVLLPRDLAYPKSVHMIRDGR